MPRIKKAREFRSAQRENPLAGMHNNEEVLQQVGDVIKDNESRQEVLDSMQPFSHREGEVWASKVKAADDYEEAVRQEIEQNSLKTIMSKSVYAGIIEDLKNQPEVLRLIENGKREEASQRAVKYAMKKGTNDPEFLKKTKAVVKYFGANKVKQLKEGIKAKEEAARVNAVIKQNEAEKAKWEKENGIKYVKDEEDEFANVKLSDEQRQNIDDLKSELNEQTEKLENDISDYEYEVEDLQDKLSEYEGKRRLSKADKEDMADLEEQLEEAKNNLSIAQDELKEVTESLQGEIDEIVQEAINYQEGYGRDFYSVEKGAEPGDQLDNRLQYDPAAHNVVFTTDKPVDRNIKVAYDIGLYRGQQNLWHEKQANRKAQEKLQGKLEESNNKKQELKIALDKLTEKFNDRKTAIAVLSATTGISVVALTSMLLTGDNSNG